MATFGHGWVLKVSTLEAGLTTHLTTHQDETENGLYCPAVSGTPPGPYTGQEGFLEYYEIMQAINNDTLPWMPGQVSCYS